MTYIDECNVRPPNQFPCMIYYDPQPYHGKRKGTYNVYASIFYPEDILKLEDGLIRLGKGEANAPKCKVSEGKITPCGFIPESMGKRSKRPKNSSRHRNKKKTSKNVSLGTRSSKTHKSYRN